MQWAVTTSHRRFNNEVIINSVLQFLFSNRKSGFSVSDNNWRQSHQEMYLLKGTGWYNHSLYQQWGMLPKPASNENYIPVILWVSSYLLPTPIALSSPAASEAVGAVLGLPGRPCAGQFAARRWSARALPDNIIMCNIHCAPASTNHASSRFVLGHKR